MDINTNKIEVLTEIKGFLEGYNTDIKYLVNVETNPNTNYGECVIHEPGTEPKFMKIKYTPFMYMKDLSLFGLELYGNNKDLLPYKLAQYNITITKLKTGNQKRLVNGFCYKIESSASYNSILNFLKDGKVNPYEKLTDDDGNIRRDFKGEPIYLFRDLFNSINTTEQFMISNRCRLYKGYNEYSDVHKVIFDIETSGLRHQMARVFAVGVRDNRGFETLLEVDKLHDDVSEVKLIQDLFNLITLLKPAVIAGYNSEGFDFEFILGRAKLLGMDLSEVKTTLKDTEIIKRKNNVSVKYGNTTDKYTATQIWGISVIDIIHAVKKTAAVNTEIKSNKLKEVAKYEKIAKPNRTYVNGEGNDIFRFYEENKTFVVNDKNEYIQVPDKHQEVANRLYKLQANKGRITDIQYDSLKRKYLSEDREFVEWFRGAPLQNNMVSFISGKRLIRQYLLDDLWETEKVDELYNQSAFMLAKIVPTTFHRICTMGTASIWNLLLTAWSYENDLAIPHSDVKEKFVGGLARCYKRGWSKRWVKIDYASLYPMIQLTHGVFPIFDITGVIKKMLLYLTTTRNIYKKLANADELNKEEIYILKEIDHETYLKFTNGEITDANRAMFKTKQLPIKILNNSLFGALGSDRSFNWSDNMCAARITCIGRLRLRHAIKWFMPYNCVPLLAVTDGINFNIPETSNIILGATKDEPNIISEVELPIQEAWRYGNKTGIAALIEKFNTEEMIAPFMSVDNDGEFISCLNLSRINYATLSLAKDKKSGEMKEKIKLTGNTIKSKVMPEYIEEFIDKGLKLILHGKGREFVEYYYSYADDIYFKRIPLKKIATKSRIKNTISVYQKRGNDKNGREKGKQAHMELLIEKRAKTVNELFEKHKAELIYSKDENKLTIADKLKLVANYMPAEPELDSVVYFVNTGYKKGDSNSGKVIDINTKEERYCATMITVDDLKDNPEMMGEYNVPKYLSAFNLRVKTILVGFEPEIAKKILVKIKKKVAKDQFGNKTSTYDLIGNLGNFTSDELELKSFDSDDVEESMIIEPKEVSFWNRSGYDPRMIWNGFKMLDTDKVHFEIYENALEYLNEKMKASGKPLIKAISDKYDDGDMVLIKNGEVFSLGLYNGTYLKIIREEIEIPKSKAELEAERIAMELEEKTKLTADVAAIESENEIRRKKEADDLIAKREKYFIRFKKKYKISTETELTTILAMEGAELALDEFIDELECEEENEAIEMGEFEFQN